MTPIDRSIAAARQRIFLQTTLHALGWAALAGLAIGAAVLVAGRLCAVPAPRWIYLVMGGVAVAVAPLIAWSRQPGIGETAGLIDERLGLKDRLGTALYAESISNDPFARRVVEDAQTTAGGLRLGQAFRVRFTRVWGWVPVATAVVLLLIVFTPAMDLLGIGSQRSKRMAQQLVASQSKEETAKAIQAVEKLKENEPSLKDKQTDESMAKLAELTKSDLRDPEMRKNAAVNLTKVEEKLAEAAEQKEREAKALQNALSRTDPKMAGPADNFADALRRGDFDQAQQELQSLSKAAQDGKLGEAQKQAAAKQLENIAQQLDQSAQQSEAQKDQAEAQAKQALQNAGLTKEQVEQLQKQGMTKEQMKEALENQGVKPAQAQQTAQRAADKLNDAKNSSSTAKSTRSLSSPLQKLSESMCQNPSPATQPGNAASQSQKPGQSQAQKPSQTLTQSQTPSQCASEACDKLGQMSQSASQAKEMRSSQSQVQQAMRSMSGNPSQPATNQPTAQRIPGGQGGSQWGVGSGGNPLGEERKLAGYQTEASSDMNPREGRVIASWMSDGEIGKGEAKVSFNQAVTEAKQEAEKAVTDDRVPQRYHGAIKDYFDQLPATPDEK